MGPKNLQSRDYGEKIKHGHDMSIFNQAFSPEMAPSIDERTTGDFQRAHGLVHGFINSKGRLTAENVANAIRECFAEVQSSFSSKTRAEHEREVRQFVRNARAQLEQLREEIQSTETTSSQVFGSKRSGEDIQEESVEAKRAREGSSVMRAEAVLPEEIYQGLLAKLKDPQRVQECYSQLSPDTLKFLEHLKELGIGHQEEFISTSIELLNLSTPQDIASTLSKLSEFFVLLKSLPNPHATDDCLMIALCALEHDFMIENLYPGEDRCEVWKRILNPTINHLLANKGKVHGSLIPILILSGGSEKRIGLFLPFSGWFLNPHGLRDPSFGKILMSLSDDELENAKPLMTWLETLRGLGEVGTPEAAKLLEYNIVKLLQAVDRTQGSYILCSTATHPLTQLEKRIKRRLYNAT